MKSDSIKIIKLSVIKPNIILDFQEILSKYPHKPRKIHVIFFFPQLCNKYITISEKELGGISAINLTRYRDLLLQFRYIFIDIVDDNMNVVDKFKVKIIDKKKFATKNQYNLSGQRI